MGRPLDKQPVKRTGFQTIASAANRIAKAVLGLLIISVAGGLLYFIFWPSLKSAFQARHWQETSCRIIASAVEKRSSRIFQADIRFAYSVDGRSYNSDRYGFGSGLSRDRNEVAVIVQQYPLGLTTVCFYDPKDPSESVLNRHFTEGSKFVFIPILGILVGIGFFIAAFWPAGPAKPIADPPWLARPDWAQGHIENSVGKGLQGLWVFGLMWTGISLLILVLGGPQPPGNPSDGKWLVCLFLGVGLGPLGYAFWARLPRWKFPGSFFEMTTIPGVVGGVLEGQIRVNQLVRFQRGIQLKLICVLCFGNRRGIIWQTKNIMAHGGALDSIPVLFVIPADRQPTGLNYQWLLEAKGLLPGINYRARFEVPVFAASPGLVQTSAAERAISTDRVAQAQYHPSLHSGVTVQASPAGGHDFNFTAKRNHGAAVLVTCILPVWTGMLWLAFHCKAPLMFPIMFGLFEVLLICGMVELWFRNQRIVFETGRVTVTSDLLLYHRRRTIALGEIERFYTVHIGSSPDHTIKLALRNGTTLTVVTRIKSAREADWFVKEMSKAAGLQS